MKIIQQNEKSLVLKNSNVVSIIIGIGFAFVGAFIAYESSATNGFGGIETWLPIIFSLVGIAVVVFSRSKMFDFDKERGKFTIKKKGLFGTAANEYGFGDIAGIELSEQYRSETVQQGNVSVSRPELFENLSVAMKDGRRIGLDSGRAGFATIGGISVGNRGRQDLGQTMASFIGVPFNKISALGGKGSGLTGGGIINN